jgi:hypothetical protein
MKFPSYAASLAAAALLAAGCNKSEQANAPDSPEVKQVANGDPQTAAGAQPSSVAEATAANAQRGSADAPASLTSRAQLEIDNAKRLLTEERWAEALKKLNDLSAARLTS